MAPASAAPDPSDAAAPGGVEIRDLDTVEQVFEAAAVLGQVWGGDDGGMPPNLLRALAHSGNYVVGLYAVGAGEAGADRMIGASAAFAAPGGRSLHSHITGILGGYRAHGLGRRLKQHQREWALARGVERITWTFDPLVARNAHFNLGVLGARATDYLVDHYGAMDDGVNRGDETDRLFVSWELAGAAGPSVPDERDVVTTVEIPADIEGLRRDDPAEALDWRYRVRDALTGLLDDGLVIAGFDARGYLLARR